MQSIYIYICICIYIYIYIHIHTIIFTRTPAPHLCFVLAAAIPRESQSVRGEAATPLPIWWVGELPSGRGIVPKHLMPGNAK